MAAPSKLIHITVEAKDMTPELRAVISRVEELESQVAHLAALVTEQSDTGRTIAAHSFVVKDGDDCDRARLGMLKDPRGDKAQPVLQLLDPDGRARIGAGVDQQGAWFELQTSSGSPFLQATEMGEGKSRVALHDADGNLRLSFFVSTEEVSVHLLGADKRQHVEVSLFSSGEAKLVMNDATGDPRVLLAVEERKGPILAFMTGEEVIWRIPSQ